MSPDTRQEDGVGSRVQAGSREEELALGTFVKLMRAGRWTSLAAGKYREGAGFTEGQFSVLEALYHVGPLAPTQLARKLLTSTSNLTLVIDNLERDGFVTRQPSTSDRRSVEIHLTAKGRRRMRDLFPRHAAWITEIMSILSPTEKKTLGRLCRKLGTHAADLT